MQLFENRNDAEHINCSILVAEIVNQLLMEVETPGLSREYTENNIIPGNMIVITDGQCTREAYAESIAPDGRLLVREQEVFEETLAFLWRSICTQEVGSRLIEMNCIFCIKNRFFFCTKQAKIILTFWKCGVK